jgi:hypothetical protein
LDSTDAQGRLQHRNSKITEEIALCPLANAFSNTLKVFNIVFEQDMVGMVHLTEMMPNGGKITVAVAGQNQRML